MESAFPEDETVDYDLWKGDAEEIDKSMLQSQTTLQDYDVDVKDYSSLMKSEAETQVCPGASSGILCVRKHFYFSI